MDSEIVRSRIDDLGPAAAIGLQMRVPPRKGDVIANIRGCVPLLLVAQLQGVS